MAMKQDVNYPITVKQPDIGEFFLFTVVEMIDGLETTNYRVAETQDPVAKAKELAEDEHRDETPEWNEDSSCFNGIDDTTTFCRRWRMISPTEAAVILEADRIKLGAV